MTRAFVLPLPHRAWRLVIVGGIGMLLAMTLLLTSNGTARADECYTQGYDYSGGWHDFYTYSYPCVGGAAPWYLYYGAYPSQPYWWYGYTVPTYYNVPIYQPYYRMYYQP